MEYCYEIIKRVGKKRGWSDDTMLRVACFHIFVSESGLDTFEDWLFDLSRKEVKDLLNDDD